MGFLIDMIDVGEGDSFLLTIDDAAGNEVYVLIDAGLPEQGPKVVQHLQKYAPAGLQLVIATHIDNDHIGGLRAVAESVPIENFVLNVPTSFVNSWFGLRKQLGSYRKQEKYRRLAEAVEQVQDLIALLNRQGIKPSPAIRGKWWKCADTTLRVLNPTPERLQLAWQESDLLREIQLEQAAKAFLAHRTPTPIAPTSLNAFFEAMAKKQPLVPTPRNALLDAIMSAGVKKPEEETDAPSTSAENDSSIVLEIEYKGQPYGLMTSDAGAAVLKDVTEGKTYSFLKVPHHGSKTGLDEELIRQLAPKTAFLPVGENKHGHPAIEILELLRDVKARTFCSSKTPNCRKDCRRGGFGTISHRKDKAGHDGWISVTPGQCANNLPAVG